jgi:hypothetical protein
LIDSGWKNTEITRVFPAIVSLNLNTVNLVLLPKKAIHDKSLSLFQVPFNPDENMSVMVFMEKLNSMTPENLRLKNRVSRGKKYVSSKWSYWFRQLHLKFKTDGVYKQRELFLVALLYFLWLEKRNTVTVESK